jgi:hypothetical protein
MLCQRPRLIALCYQTQSGIIYGRPKRFISLDTNLKDEAGSPPHVGWFSAEHLARLENLIAKLQTSNTKESFSRYHAMAKGYLLGLLDCYHVSAEHHGAVRQYLHILAVKRLRAVKPRRSR